MIGPIEVMVEAGPAAEYLRAVQNQVPFALAMAINRTAEEAIAQQKLRMSERFTIRRPWVRDQFFLNKRADKKEEVPSAVLAVGKSAGFLLRFEEGGPQHMKRDAFGVERPFAIPTPTIRPNFQALVPAKLYPVNLGVFYRAGVAGHFTPVGGAEDPFGIRAGAHKASRRKTVAREYFVMRPGGKASAQQTQFEVDKPGAGVWMRMGSGAGTGRGGDRIRLIWKFKSSITLPPALKFKETTDGVIADRFEVNFDGFMAFAIATAK